MRRVAAWFLLILGFFAVAIVTLLDPYDSWGDPPHLRVSTIPEIAWAAKIAILPNMLAIILTLSASQTRRSVQSIILVGLTSLGIAAMIAKLVWLHSLSHS